VITADRESPPHDDAAEAALLGAALVGEPAAAELVCEHVGEFFNPSHQVIAQAIADVFTATHAVEPALVASRLQGHPAVRDADCLETLVQYRGIGAFDKLADAIRTKAIARKWIDVCHLISRKAAEVNGDASGLIGLADSLVRDAQSMGAGLAQLNAISFAALQQQHSELRPAVIDGLVRQGETANIVAGSKVGKSWLVYDIAGAIITGGAWLGLFSCTRGRVLLIDNELHPSTIAHRIPKVAEARGVDPAIYAEGLDVLSLRGKNVSLPDLARYVRKIQPGQYSAIICDAWYRFIPSGLNENSNADVMRLYNLLDGYAADTQAAWIVVHHASKGGQAEKSVTDVGAGAGSQSRAADAHIVLRPHEDTGCVVLEAALRSFPPFAAITLRWHHPVWTVDPTLDPASLKGRKPQHEQRQDAKDAEGLEAIRAALQAQPLTLRKIREKTGLSPDRAERLLHRLTAAGEVTSQPTIIRGNSTHEYRLSL
jgi:hypothetical protein